MHVCIHTYIHTAVGVGSNASFESCVDLTCSGEISHNKVLYPQPCTYAAATVK